MSAISGSNDPLKFLALKRDRKRRKKSVSSSASLLEGNAGDSRSRTMQGFSTSQSVTRRAGINRGSFTFTSTTDSLSGRTPRLNGLDNTFSFSRLPSIQRRNERDNYTPQSSQLTEENHTFSDYPSASPTQAEHSDSIPMKPVIEDAKCHEIVSLLEERDQLIYTWEKLKSPDENLKREIVSIEASDDIGIRTVKDHLQSIYNSTFQIKKNPSLFDNFNDHYGLLLRHKDGGSVQTEGVRNSENFPMFVNSAVMRLSDVGKSVIFLPIKRSTAIEPKSPSLPPLNRHEACTNALWDWIVRELVLIRVDKTIQPMNIESYAGFSVPPMSPGEKAWVPYCVAGKLCCSEVAHVIVPEWLSLESLQKLKSDEENQRNGLTQLPCHYFFEISYLFNLFQSRPKSFFNSRICYKGPRCVYISKAGGVIERLQQIRESKIIHMLAGLLEQNHNAFVIPGIQIYETTIVHEMLSAIWDKEHNFSDEEAYPRVHLTLSHNRRKS